MQLDDAFEDILLGESLAGIHARHQLEALGIEDEKKARRRLRDMDREERRELEEAATRFVGDLCRKLGEARAGEDRIATLLRDWAERSKAYEAFDALLCNFEFAGKAQVLAEGRRLFPSTLTAHWSE